MGGEQTIRELLKIDPDVKAIVSSGYFNDPVMSDFEKYGFMGALSKPYEKKALKEVLERLSE
jgi:DNA-binding NarL/FixJ family response regulator